jgi:sulfur-oxidizing protein SoxX
MVRQYHLRDVWLIALVGTAMPAAGLSTAPNSERSTPQTAGLSRPLTDKPADAARGMAVAADPNRGNCVICHEIPLAGVQPAAYGDIGPSLQGVGSRLTVPQLRQRLVDPKTVSPQTVMPAYFKTTGLTRVRSPYVGKPVLSAQDIEDVVAYLATLR